MPKEHLSYDSIGTASSPATLTAAFSGNRQTHLSKFMHELHIDFQYTPKTGQTNRLLYILVEASNDNGTTWFPLSLRSNQTTESLVYTDDPAGANGIPFTIPGDKTSTGGTTLAGFLDVNDFTAEKVRVSAKESGSANFGTVYIRTTLMSKSS